MICKWFKDWWNKELPKVEIPPLPDYIEGEKTDNYEFDVMKEIIEYRKMMFLMRDNTDLIQDRTLNRIATSHSKFMAKNEEASHKNFPRRSMWCRRYADAKQSKEIVAGGYGTPKGVFNGWYNSEGHNKVMRWAEATHYGVSVEKGLNNHLYYTVIFIKK